MILSICNIFHPVWLSLHTQRHFYFLELKRIGGFVKTITFNEKKSFRFIPKWVFFFSSNVCRPHQTVILNAR